MRSVISTIHQKLEISAIRDIQVSETVADGAGGYVRSIKFMGEPEASAGLALVLEVTIQSQDKDDLDITTPELSF